MPDSPPPDAPRPSIEMFNQRLIPIKRVKKPEAQSLPDNSQHTGANTTANGRE
ncbi:MAG: hypothetical protein ORN98_08420 [Alphaproteobacteria bacterium]|nr:hypothetical protein [Alphaproteobacteria bacterium]